MTKREIQPLHELAKLEYTFRMLYFLRDLGVKSASKPAQDSWYAYATMCAKLQVGG